VTIARFGSNSSIVRGILECVTGTTLLVQIFIVWTAACTVVATASVRHAPAVSLALLGSVFGAIAGFLVGNADGPAEAPAYTAVGASIGLVANGCLGVLATRGRPPSQTLGRAAWIIVLGGPVAAGVMTMLLQIACPLYITGRGTGFCNYQEADVLGGWVSGVIVAFVFDAWFVAGLFMLAARQALREEDATDPKWRHLAGVDA
jgi:hypothetical protein